MEENYVKQKEEIIKKFEDLIEYANENLKNSFLDSSLKTALSEIKNKIKNLKLSANSPFSIAVVGAQGVGKSTFINLLYNTLFDVGEIMPSTFNENEGIIIKIKKAPDDSLVDKARLFDENFNPVATYEKKEFLHYIDLAESNKTTDDFFKDKPFMEFYPDIQGLDTFEIINTPGLNVIAGDFYEKVKKIFIEADLVVWVNSDTKILDNFNTNLMNKIYKDNQRVISILTKIDDLYSCDERNGIFGPIEQFLQKIENKILVREKGQICLFPYDGYRTQISKNLKSKLLFDEKEETLDDIKLDLEMIWNYFTIGFAYSNDVEALARFRDFNLYGFDKEKLPVPEEFPKKFEEHTFFDWLVKEEIIEKKGSEFFYTESKGFSLLANMSNYDNVIRFCESFLESTSLKNKLDNVLKKYNEQVKTNEFAILKQKFTEMIEKENAEYQKFCEDFEETKITIKEKFIERKNTRINTKSEYLSSKLLNKIMNGLSKKISKLDISNEMFFNIPGINNLRKESSFENKLNDIVTESFEKLFEEELEKIVGEAQEFINRADLNIDYSKMSLGDDSISQMVQTPDLNDLGRIIEFVRKRVLKIFKDKQTKEEIKKQILKFSKKDLRKRGNPKIKGMVKFIRKMMKKVGIKESGKKLKKEGGKKVLTTVGKFANPVLIALDVADMVLTVNNMLQECKNEVRKQLQNQGNDFTEQIRNALEDIYQNILNNILIKFDEEMESIKPGVETLIKNKEVCSLMVEKLEDCQNSINKI